MRHFTVVFTALIFSFCSNAQTPYEHAEYIQSSFNPAYVFHNPAFSNDTSRLVINYYRIEDYKYAPETGSDIVNAQYSFKSKWRIGIQINQDRFYYSHRFRTLGVNVAKCINLGENITLDLGLKVGYNHQR